MGPSKLFRKNFRRSLAFWLILSGIMLIPSSTLIRPVRSDDTQWWNQDWSFRKQIVLDHTMVSADLVNFPVLIIDTDLRGAQPSGNDIVFISDQDVKLNHEIEFYNSDSGYLVAWVEIPLLNSTVDTTIYMYYGNLGASNQQNQSAVWDSGFVMVQHLDETSTVMRYDSTINHNNGTAYGGVSKSVFGKIDGADSYDGVNDFVSVASSASLNPSTALTVELWMNLTSTGNNYINLVSKNAYSQYYLRLGKNQGNTYWWVKFSDGSFGTTNDTNIGWKWNTWHHLVATVDTQAQTISLYLDGSLKFNGTFASGKSLASTTKPLYISGPSSNWVNGSVDEVRISNVARSSAWIQTSYNNQKNPTTFCMIGNKEINPNPNLGPVVYENPLNGSTGIYTNPTLSVTVADPNNGTMTVIFREQNMTGTWVLRTYENVPDGTYYANATQMRNLGTAYNWSVSVGNGESWTNKTYTLTTTTQILQQKWIASTGLAGVTGVLAADINGDGKDEVIYAGDGGVVALYGSNGSTIWRFSDSAIVEPQPQMADLDHDGILEIIVPLESPAGILVLHSNNGSVYWRRTDLGKEIFSGPVVFDIDGSGYPTIFVGSTDTSHGLLGTGRLTSLSYDGRILHQTFIWRPCSGGLSLADADQDGEFEVYTSDRWAYSTMDSPWADNDYGRGVQCYWARNLTLKWSRPDIFCSSQKPMIADANKDGKLDVIAGDLNGGWWVLNASDGSTINYLSSIQAPSHYQPSVYDIDNDGHLEILTSDGSDEAKNNDTVVYDLFNKTLKADLPLGHSHYGPQVGDVNGDGLMEIIAATENGLFIIDGKYTTLTQITGFNSTLNYGVLQDIDGDGYNELMITTTSGKIYVYDTPARRPDPRPRTEVQFYSEYRRGAAEYVMPQTGPAPVVFSPNPQDQATNVTLSFSRLEFTLIDYQHDNMSYSVTTYPNIGSGTGVGGNGRYYVSVSNLMPYTTYTWNITATDGIHQTKLTYSFTTRSISPWFSSDWKYRKTITIDHNRINSTLSNFPVLIDITDSNLSSEAQPSGNDIVFTDANNNPLNYEIELYNSTTGHLIAWVNIPLLSSTTDTALNMYYGNLTIGNQQRPTQTWDSGFVMVQHLDETSTVMRYDSTINRNNGTAYGGVSKSVFGKIDGADSFNGVDGNVSIPSSASLNPSTALTVELWMNLSSTGNNYINLVSKDPWNQYYLRLGASEGNTYWYVKFSDNTIASVEGKIGWKFNTWHHLVATVDTQAQTISVYLDGSLKLNGTFASGKSLASTTKPLYISAPSPRWVNGSVDEVRISNVARSSAWIQTSYNNQKNPTTFCIEGDEESIPIGPIIYDPAPINKATGIPTSITALNFSLNSPQHRPMNYTVTTYPNIGSGNGANVNDGQRCSISVSNLTYSITYKWTVNVTADGLLWTNITFSFITYPSTPPTQDTPTLTSVLGNLVCTNQNTTDTNGNKVTNIYNWYRNGTSLTNLLLSFDTNNSATTRDYSGYGNDGLIIKGATWTPNGKIGGAYSFDKGYIMVPGSDTLDGGGNWSEITVEHWIYLTATQSGDRRTIARIPSYEIGVDSQNHVFASVWVDPHNSSTSGFNNIKSNLKLSLSNWYYVVLTYKSGVGLKLYVNGAVWAQSGVISGNIQGSGFNPLYIGWFDYFKGKIDEVRIYSRSFSPSQIGQRYAETKDGLTNSSTILKIETQVGEVWRCEVTPNDSYIDGVTKSSDSVTQIPW